MDTFFVVAEIAAGCVFLAFLFQIGSRAADNDLGSTTDYTEPRVSVPRPYLDVIISPYMLSLVNRQRRDFKMSNMFNEDGFRNAIAYVSRHPGTRQPRTLVDWLTYLTLFEADDTSYTAHQAHSVSVFIVIRPSQPNLGQDEEFGGGGRPSHWGFSDVTPARDAAERLVDPYAQIAADIYGKGLQ